MPGEAGERSTVSFTQLQGHTIPLLTPNEEWGTPGMAQAPSRCRRLGSPWATTTGQNFVSLPLKPRAPNQTCVML